MLKIRYQGALLPSIITALVIFSGNLLSALPTKAQVRVSPLVINSESRQGKATGVISLTNTGTTPARMRLQAAPFTYDSNGFKILESSPNDLSPYLIFSPAEVLLLPGETRRVRLLALLLPSLTEAEYRAVILTEPLTEKESKGGLSVISRIGVVFYVRQGEIKELLSIVGASYSREHEKIILSVNNEGNVTIRPEINWTLKQAGKEIDSGKVSAITIIAQGERNIALDNNNKEKKTIPTGDYELSGELLWGTQENPTVVPFSFPIKIP